jgi:hypothetical protein
MKKALFKNAEFRGLIFKRVVAILRRNSSYADLLARQLEKKFPQWYKYVPLEAKDGTARFVIPGKGRPLLPLNPRCFRIVGFLQTI